MNDYITHQTRRSYCAVSQTYRKSRCQVQHELSALEQCEGRACTVSVISFTLSLPFSRSRASYLTSKGTPALSPMAVPSVLLVTSTWTPTNCDSRHSSDCELLATQLAQPQMDLHGSLKRVPTKGQSYSKEFEFRDALVGCGLLDTTLHPEEGVPEADN